MNLKNQKINPNINKFSRMQAIGLHFLNLVYPKHCPVCDELLGYESSLGIHKECARTLTYIQDPICLRCGKSLHDEEDNEFCYDCIGKLRTFNPIHSGRGVFVYQGDIKLMMYKFKYSNRASYGDFFAKAMVRIRGQWIKAAGFDVIVPIPMYKRKQTWRGYNQAEEFAKALGKLLEIPVDSKLVERTKNTRALKRLTPEERKNNLKNAFHVTNSIVKYRKILLVDDIYTTGSTVEAVAGVLLQAGASEVRFCVVCIGNGF